MFIRDLWILLKEGLLIFQHVISEDVNPDLFAGMLSALNTFAKNLSEGGITSFDIDEHKRFVLVKKNHCIFVTRTLCKYDIDLIQKELGSIAKLFSEKYENKKLKDWVGGDTIEFSKFEEELKRFLDT